MYGQGLKEVGAVYGQGLKEVGGVYGQGRVSSGRKGEKGFHSSAHTLAPAEFPQFYHGQ